MNRQLRIPILTAALALLVPSVAAQIAYAGPAGVIRDCSADGVLNGHYTQGELQGALKSLPSDVDEYTDCRSVIRQATLNKAGGDATNPRSAYAKVDPNAPPTADEQQRVGEATKSGAGVTIGGHRVRPGDPGFLASAFNSHIPGLLIALLVMFGLTAIAGSALLVQHRWPRVAEAVAGGASRPLRGVIDAVRRGMTRFRG